MAMRMKKAKKVKNSSAFEDCHEEAREDEYHWRLLVSGGGDCVAWRVATAVKKGG